MVQWFKGLVRFIVAYARGWRPVLTRDVFSYNHEQLVKEMAEFQASLFELKQEQSWRVVREIIVRARNVQALDVARIQPTADSSIKLAQHHGRMQAFSDLLMSIDASMDQQAYEAKMADRTGQKLPAGSRKITTPFRRPSSAGTSAGAAI